MAAMAAKQTRRSLSFADACAWAVVGLAFVLATLPILCVACLCLLLLAVLRPPRWLPLLVVMVGGALWLGWLHLHGVPLVPLFVRLGLDYAATQRDAGLQVSSIVQLHGPPVSFPWWWYARSVGGVSLLVGGGLSVCLWTLGVGPWAGRQGGGGLRLVGADALAKLAASDERTIVDGLVAQGRLTAITALPKKGKTFAWFGLLRARQDGGTWFGHQCQPGRTLILSEEDRATFAAKVQQFGITSRTLVSIHAPEVAPEAFTQAGWAAFIDEAARQAKRARCDTLDVDTLTTWAPWVIQSPDSMSFCLRTLKAAVGRHQLAGVVILHNRKSGGEAVVAALGTIAGPAAYDVIAGFDREKDSGVCTLTVDGRLGEWKQTARLEGQRYVVLAAPTPAPSVPIERADYHQYLTSAEWADKRDATLERAGGVCEACGTAEATTAHHKTYDRIGEEAPDDLAALCASCHRKVHHGTPLPDLPPHVAATLNRLRTLDEPATVQELAAMEGVTRVPMLARLKPLEDAGLVTVEGSGKPGDPKRWRVA